MFLKEKDCKCYEAFFQSLLLNVTTHGTYDSKPSLCFASDTVKR